MNDLSPLGAAEFIARSNSVDDYMRAGYGQEQACDLTARDRLREGLSCPPVAVSVSRGNPELVAMLLDTSRPVDWAAAERLGARL